MKVIVLALTATVIAFTAWQFADPSLYEELRQRSSGLMSSMVSGKAATGQSASSSAASAGIRKCKIGNEVIYSDAPCPAGHAEQQINAGTVTVIKGQRPSIPTPSLPSSIPNARALLGEPLEQSLMDKQIERATR